MQPKCYCMQNDSVATLLARLEGILGPMPRWMLHRGRYVHKYYVRDGRIYEKNMHTVRVLSHTAENKPATFVLYVYRLPMACSFIVGTV